MTAGATRLDVSIGPVQGFVSQSRRTRDLWGSSYLLAFLSAHAMRGANEAGGEIVHPVVENDPLYRWVRGRGTGDAPSVGTVPNHFVVKLRGDARPAAEAAAAALNASWKRVCGAVWEQFVDDLCSAGNGTEAIWERQVRTFWEVSWTAGPWSETAHLLARRKHWRSKLPPEEPGDKCTMMHDLQELSGHVRARSGGQQGEFWKRMRQRLGSLDVRDNERLCAVAFVKRLFPKVASLALGWEVTATHWPSTVYVGAVPWIRRVVETAPDQACEYAEAVRGNASSDVFPMQHPPFSGLSAAAAGDFHKLDGNYLHREYVTNERLCPLSGGGASGERDRLAKLLSAIYDATDRKGRRLGSPPMFYALLLADGDRLGKLVERLGGPVVSHRLESFTDKVPCIVKAHDGVTVYAGGDDVLAMLPVQDALSCANDMAAEYRKSFAATDAENEATISSAVVLAHVRLPLQSVLAEAHTLLDDVAKDGNGRNSLATAVVKPGGKHCQWVTSWSRPAAGGSNAVSQIDDLIQFLGDSDGEPGLSGALVYRLRQTLVAICDWDRWEPGTWGDVPAGIDVRPFLEAEIAHSLDVRTNGAGTRAAGLTARVYSLLRQSHSTDDKSSGIGIDALLLARFLADPEQQEAER